MNLSRFFIDRPIFAGVISVAIVLAGLISMFQLPISEYPEVVPPSVIVRALYPGANPNVLAETVATPLEEQINGAENMLYMFSQASTDGTLTLTVTFKLGTDPDLAQQIVQNRVNQALPRLPEATRHLRRPIFPNHHQARQWRRDAPEGRGAHRSRCRRIRPAVPARQQAGGRDSDLPSSGLERHRNIQSGPRHDGGA